MTDDLQTADEAGIDDPAERLGRRQVGTFVLDDDLRHRIRDILYWLDPESDFYRRESALGNIERVLGGLDG